MTPPVKAVSTPACPLPITCAASDRCKVIHVGHRSTSARTSAMPATANAAGASFVLASGQLANFTAISSTGVSVLNASCVDNYYLLVQVTIPIM
jgi:hypothetical protein